jgi:hypothetical protein
MSFVIRPLFAVAALALATPAFAADIGTTVAPTATVAPKADVKASATVPTDTKTAVTSKTDSTVKTPAAPTSKEKSSAVVKKDKVSEASHHHVKTPKHA